MRAPSDTRVLRFDGLSSFVTQPPLCRHSFAKYDVEKRVQKLYAIRSPRRHTPYALFDREWRFAVFPKKCFL